MSKQPLIIWSVAFKVVLIFIVVTLWPFIMFTLMMMLDGYVAEWVIALVTALATGWCVTWIWGREYRPRP